MESPVMTSASSHRLRSAVSACAQPTHSFLGSSYLGTIQCESHDSGGCYKKFTDPGKNGSLLATKKHQASNGECSALYKRHKPSTKSCFVVPKTQHRTKNNSSSNGVLDVISKRFAIGNNFLSKLTSNENWSGNRLENGQVVFNKGSSNDDDGSHRNKILNHRSYTRGKSCCKSTRRGGPKDREKDGSERGDECPNRGAVTLGGGYERREISKWQPEHMLTRRTAQIVREIQNVWQTRAGCSKSVPTENVQLLFNDLQLYPTASEVSKMLECAREFPENSTSNFVSFGDFFKIASDLFKFSKNCRASETSSLPSVEKNVERRDRKFSRGMSKYEVFLGGSCNPTTWRTDVAIPKLEEMGISYYNPQVENWKPELMEVEYYAKENATVMFFVIDNQTRGVSALIEVAHLAGNQRKLILVIQSYAQAKQMICDEEISQTEYEDLKTGQEVLQLLVERQGIPVFDSIEVALGCTEKILRENLNVQDLRHPTVRVEENSLDLQELFEMLDSENSGEISFLDVCLACEMATGRRISTAASEYFLEKSGMELNGTRPEDVKFDFRLFYESMTEFMEKLADKHSDSPPFSYFRDVYLGGTIENTSWRESVAIPALKSHNLTFFVPRVSEGKEGFTEVEAAAMDHSHVLLFVITNTARSIAAMAIAGHYIGKGADVVLCVQHLSEEATIADEKLSESAVKDYNRARMYLMDIAERSGVPVFEEISKVVEHIVRESRQR